MEDKQLGMQSKKQLQEIAGEMDIRLEKYWEEEQKHSFGFENTERELVKKIIEHAKEHNLRPAKRVRAAFVYYGYLLGDKEPDEGVWQVMEGVELVQTALLMHDDFMDEDKLRRGLPTTQEYFKQGDKHYGESMAVNVGDLVLCLGYERVLGCGLEDKRVLEAGKELMRGIANTAQGQAYDVSLPKLGELSEEKVLAVHRTKTAIYTFQNPLLMGGILAGLNKEVLDILKRYAEKGGIAFQLQDDVLGLFGETEKTGKSIDSDILQGKSTLLVAKTLELGNEKQKQILLKAWGNKKATAKEIEEAKEAVKESGSYDYSVEYARKLANEAVEITKELDRYSLNEKAVQYMRGIAEYLVRRDF